MRPSLFRRLERDGAGRPFHLKHRGFPRCGRGPCPCSGGFSLVELLTVLGIMAILVTFGLSSMGSSTAHQLNTGGNRVVNLVNQARQNSITKHTMTALILLTGTNQAAVDNRFFVIEEFNPVTSTWQQISKWESLPPGVVVDNAATNPSTDTFITSVPSLNAPAAFPTVTYMGLSIPPTGYACQVFLPRGQLLSTATTLPPVLRLVSGTDNNGAIIYTAGSRGATLNNYYDVIINPYTGIPKINRP